MTSLRDRVFESLNNGVENCPEIVTWTESDLTDDLLAYDVDYDAYEKDEILPYVRQWLEEKRKTP